LNFCETTLNINTEKVRRSSTQRCGATARSGRQRGSVCRHSASAVFAEFERTLIQERIRAGIAKAKTTGTRSGKPFGRPHIPDSRRIEIESLLRDGYGIRKVARMTHSGNGVVQRIKEALAQTNPPDGLY
jgi:DNA invertase Pin-like site-specific DNA recombinase